MQDNLRWNESKCDKYSVRSLYSSLLEGHNVPFLASIVWKAWAPLNVNFFAWEASWGRILTVNQLKRRGRLGVTCAKVQRKWQTTCSFIAPKQEWWGIWFSLFLGWSRLCILQLEGTCWVDMTLLWGKSRKKHGGPLQLVWCRLFGRAET